MKVKKLWTHSNHPLLDVDTDISNHIEQILNEDVPASIILREERQEEPVWGRRKRYGWFGSEKMIQTDTVSKKRVHLVMEYHEPRHIENVHHDFQRVRQILLPINFWNAEVIFDGMNFLTGKWNVAARSDPGKKITDPIPPDSMEAIATFWGLVDSDEMRQALQSLAGQLYEPVKTSRNYYTTTYHAGSCSGYPPQIKLAKSWEGFDEARLLDFFEKIQGISNAYSLMEKWREDDRSHHILFHGQEPCMNRYKLDLVAKTCKREVYASDNALRFDYPSLEVTAKIWRNSTHENEAMCFFQLRHETKLTAYRRP